MAVVIAKSPKGQRWAKFFNSLGGALAKFIIPGPGIEIFSNGGRGITISTKAMIYQAFKIIDSGEGISYFGPREAQTVTNANSVNSLPYRPYYDSDSDAADDEVYLTYTDGWHPEGTLVLCANIAGRWEVINPGHMYAEGHLTENAPINALNLYTVDLGSSFYAGQLYAKFRFTSFEGFTGEYVQGVWSRAHNSFQALIKPCPPEVP